MRWRSAAALIETILVRLSRSLSLARLLVLANRVRRTALRPRKDDRAARERSYDRTILRSRLCHAVLICKPTAGRRDTWRPVADNALAL